MRREQWFTGFGEVSFTRVQQTVDPWQQFFRAMVGVQDDWHAVMFCHLMHMMCARDCTQDCSALWHVSFQAFTCDERSAAVRELNDNRGTDFRSSFENGVD